jgi:hypothetical protein
MNNNIKFSEINTLLNDMAAEEAFSVKFPLLNIYIDLLENFYYYIKDMIKLLLNKKIKAHTVISFIFQRVHRNKKIYDTTWKQTTFGSRFGLHKKDLSTFYDEVISACALLSDLDYDTTNSLTKNKPLLSKYTKALNTLSEFILYDSI